MMDDAPHLQNYRYVARPRRTREGERFVTGTGTYVQDVQLPNTKHIAPMASPYPRARIVSIDASAALAMPGVHAVVTGADLARDTEPMFQGLDIPNVRWFPLAHGITRYAGEWVAAVCADFRALAEDAAEKIEVEYEPLEPVIDPEAALKDGAPLVHPDHGTNLLYSGRFVWGPVEDDFAAAQHTLKFRARWGRSATVPIETFGALASWNRGTKILDVWASIQMTNYAEQLAHALRLPANAVAVHQEVDVGGSYGTKRGMKHTILCGYLARKLGFPVRFIEDRIDNLAAGDAHGPDRIFDMEVAFESDGRIRSLRIFAIDDAGAYPGRAPFQLAKPITAIVGPYQINSVEYRPTSVTTNKSGEVAVRGFGQSPTNWAIETAVEKVARHLGMDRLELRRRNLIRKDQFPYEIPSGTKYDSGDYHTVLDKALALADYDALVKRRDAIRAAGGLAGIGIACCLEPSGGNNIHENLINPKLAVTTFMEACQIRIDLNGVVTAMMGTTTSGQGHETLVATIVAEELERDPDAIRVVHADSLVGLITRSPVASRMAIMLGGAAAGAAQKLKKKLLAIAAHNLGKPADQLEYDGGDVVDASDRSKKIGLGRALPHRPPEARPHAGGDGAGTQRASRHGGAARRQAARREQARADLPVLRLPGAHPVRRDRPGDRQSHAARLRHRARLRHGHQPGHRARHDPRRHCARHRRGALREICLRPGRAVPRRVIHGLPAALGARDAARPRRRALHPVAAHLAWPEGLGRRRLSRRARRHRQRGQRRARAARQVARRGADAPRRHRAAAERVATRPRLFRHRERSEAIQIKTWIASSLRSSQ